MALMAMLLPCVSSPCHAGLFQSVIDSTHHVKEVVVTSKSKGRDVMPVQTLSGEQLEKLRSNSIADALRYFSGMQIKDYGGVGGLKTVNVRSMGTNHTNSMFDDITSSNFKSN